VTALLELEAARIDVDAAPLLEGVSARAEGGLVGLVGDWSALFALLGSRGRLAAGSARIAGHDATSAVADGVLGTVPLSPLLPARWTVNKYLVEGARLAGLSKRDAKDRTSADLASLALAHLSSRRIETLTPAEKRAVSLVLALADTPAVLAVEDIDAGLDDRAETVFVDLVERAARGRSLLVSSRLTSRTGPTRALFERADSVLVLEAGTLVAAGKLADSLPAEASYLVSVTGHAAELAERLTARGLAVQVAGGAGGFAALDAEVLAAKGGAARFRIRLSEGASTRTILDAALEVEAPVVELRPLTVSHE
jgi:ABC-2 type transport system ATP-binding protein